MPSLFRMGVLKLFKHVFEYLMTISPPPTPPRPEEGPGDTNNNIQDKSVPLLSTGSVLMSSLSSSSGTGASAVSGSTESRTDGSEGHLGVIKKEEDPQSPIPALVPAGGQTVFMKSASLPEQGKSEEESVSKSENVQLAVKPENDTEGTGQSAELKPHGGSSRVDQAEVKTSTGESNPKVGSESQVKQENESRNSASAAGARESEIKTENQESGQRYIPNCKNVVTGRSKSKNNKVEN